MFNKLKRKSEYKKMMKRLSTHLKCSNSDIVIFYKKFLNDSFDGNLVVDNIDIRLDESIRTGKYSIYFYLPSWATKRSLIISEDEVVTVPKWLIERIDESELEFLVEKCSSIVKDMAEKSMKDEEDKKDKIASHIRSIVRKKEV